MESIKNTLQSIMQGLVAKKAGVLLDGPEELLKKFLTKRELKHIKFNYFKRGVVNISVDSSSWLYQLNLQKQDLLAKLCGQSNKIKDVRFRLGEVK